MSLYNELFGVNQATFYVLPMLNKHPDEYPRFRDCFADDDKSKKTITVYTRVGGGNRDDYQDEIDKLTQMKGYMGNYDDDFDETYCSFVFKVPKKFEKDYELVLKGKLLETSKENKEQVEKVYPKLKGKFVWDK